MRVAHPDLPSGDPDTARRLNQAFTLLEPVYRRGATMPAPIDAGSRSPTTRFDGDDALEILRVDDDSLALVAPADEVFFRLVEVLHDLGDVVYADPEAGYLEALVHDGVGQLAVSLQGRADATEAFFTLESHLGRPVPPIDVIVRAIADRLRARS